MDNDTFYITGLDGTEYIHNIDRPAIEEVLNKTTFKQIGKYHNPNGPAYIDQYANHHQYRFLNMLHRTNGPTIIHDGKSFYYLYGTPFTYEEFIIYNVNKTLYDQNIHVSYDMEIYKNDVFIAKPIFEQLEKCITIICHDDVIDQKTYHRQVKDLCTRI